MKISKQLIVLLSISLLFFATKAFSLPVAGEMVTMHNDWTSPYTLEDARGILYDSFCLESEMYFTPGRTYNVESVGEYAYGGGGAAVDGRDKVDDSTKWLYAAFVSDVFIDLKAAAGQKVQNAIWYLEGENKGVEKDWLDLAKYSFDDTGWNVVAVNISRNGQDNQSQLVGTAPVPEPATMLLFGAGLMGLTGVRRIRKKQ